MLFLMRVLLMPKPIYSFAFPHCLPVFKEPLFEVFPRCVGITAHIVLSTNAQGNPRQIRAVLRICPYSSLLHEPFVVGLGVIASECFQFAQRTPG